MVDRRSVALGSGMVLGLSLSVVFSYYPVSPVLSVVVLAPVLMLFLYGLLATPPEKRSDDSNN